LIELNALAPNETTQSGRTVWLDASPGFQGGKHVADLKSPMLRSGLHGDWLKTATPDQIQFVDAVFDMCERHYSDGGDVVVETMDPAEIVKEFKTLDDVRSYCGLWVEQNLNARWGEDTDPQLDMARGFDKWEEEKLD